MLVDFVSQGESLNYRRAGCKDPILGSGCLWGEECLLTSPFIEQFAEPDHNRAYLSRGACNPFKIIFAGQCPFRYHYFVLGMAASGTPSFGAASGGLAQALGAKLVTHV